MEYFKKEKSIEFSESLMTFLFQLIILAKDNPTEFLHFFFCSSSS